MDIYWWSLSTVPIRISDGSYMVAAGDMGGRGHKAKRRQLIELTALYLVAGARNQFKLNPIFRVVEAWVAQCNWMQWAAQT